MDHPYGTSPPLGSGTVPRSKKSTVKAKAERVKDYALKPVRRLRNTIRRSDMEAGGYDSATDQDPEEIGPPGKAEGWNGVRTWRASSVHASGAWCTAPVAARISPLSWAPTIPPLLP